MPSLVSVPGQSGDYLALGRLKSIFPFLEWQLALTTPMANTFPMCFIESPVFTASLRRHLNDEQYRAMQAALTLRPVQGVLIPGGAGDLSPSQIRALACVVREEFK